MMRTADIPVEEYHHWAHQKSLQRLSGLQAHGSFQNSNFLLNLGISSWETNATCARFNFLGFEKLSNIPKSAEPQFVSHFFQGKMVLARRAAGSAQDLSSRASAQCGHNLT